MRRNRRFFAAAFGAATAMALAAAHAAEGLEIGESPEYGNYLTDMDGRSLYVFEKDEKNTSACYDACAGVWPPFTSEEEVQAGDGVDDSMIGTFERRDGVRQISFGGMPLYYFAADQQPGDTGGQDKEGFGAEWYLLSPEGAKIED